MVLKCSLRLRHKTDEAMINRRTLFSDPMIKTKCTHLREAILVGLACLSVAACSPQQGELGDEFFPHGKWEQIPRAPDNMVEVVTLRHVVSFAGGEVELAIATRSSLGDFIQTNRIGVGDQIVVQASGSELDRLTIGRLTAVSAEFARHGLVTAESVVLPSSSATAAPDEVAVLVTRAVVISPDCSEPQPKPTLRPDQPWGCTVKTALGRMVADPLELVEGRELGPADAE